MYTLTLSIVAVLLVVALHVGFFVLESLLWTSPKVMRIFGNTAEVAETTRVLALNQGFYNLGLAALLLWFQFTHNPSGVMGVLCFLVGMGLVGGATASRAIIILQSVPSLIALLLISMSDG